MKINQENFDDYNALTQLTNSLWSNGSLRGASVLVGSGFSRTAKLPAEDTPIPPLWGDLKRAMTNELYGAKGASNAPSEPLRLAEEYRTAFGDIGIRSFLDEHIADARWQPGEAHEKLLDLPWADILTTNYDTLLERAASDSAREYEVVRREQDLAIARSPRIIKLHGSIQDGADVIISEEDYRRYPVAHAPFVNTARQVFIENELCLLGFSGDDPNFLQWSGWVRDNLGNDARRIYLVGALQLTAVKRRLLESRNIIPIDFSPIVPEGSVDPHATASEMFLEFLKAGRPADPNEWQPKSYADYPHSDPEEWPKNFKDVDHAVATIRECVKIWRSDRESYPGWLICPYAKRVQLRQGSNINANLKLGLENLPADERRSVLLELGWRFQTSCQPLDTWLATIVEESCLAEELRYSEPNLVHALLTLLLKQKRLNDDTASLDRLCQTLLDLAPLPEIGAVVAYQKCLFAVDHLDFESVDRQLGEVDSDDPIWAVRRASLLYWVGENVRARETFRSATRDLRRRCQIDPKSISLRSRFSWARTLTDFLRWGDKGAFRDEMKRYDRHVMPGYEPKEEVRLLENQVDDAQKKQREEREIEPSFEAGTYRDNSRTVRFATNPSLTPLHEVRWLRETIGIPFSAENVNVLKTTTQNALALEFQPSSDWHLSLLSTAPSYSKGVTDKVFNRLMVARLTDEVADDLMRACGQAIAFWRVRVPGNEETSIDAIEHIRRYTEVLSRLAPRATSERAQSLVKLAVDLANDNSLNHWWLYEQIGHLLKRAFEAVPRDQRSNLTEDLLAFPTRDEKQGNGPDHSWPDPAPYAFQFIRRNKSKAKFDDRVNAWICHLRESGQSKSEAAIRLLFLHEQGQLTKGQQKQFAAALWKDVTKDDTSIPQNLQLYPHSFLIAPSPAEIDAKNRVYQNLFPKGADANPESLVAAITDRRKLIFPTKEDANRLFKNVCDWQPESDDDGFAAAMKAPIEEANNLAMADVLGVVAIPGLDKSDRTAERAEDALRFFKETGLPGVLRGLPYFYGINDSISQRILECLKTGLSSDQHSTVHAATEGVCSWLARMKWAEADKLPNSVIDYAIRALERQRPSGLANLVYLIRDFFEHDLLNDAQLIWVGEVLEQLIETTDYNRVKIDDRIAVSLSLIRVEMVRLANALVSRDRASVAVEEWLEKAKNDPLPEVRFALHELSAKA